MPGADPTPRHDEAGHRREANRAIAVSAIGLALTGGLELILAIFTGSVALLGDALHNLSDVSTSAVVFLGFRVSKRPPTAAYPYGYERAEDLAGLGVALVIWLSAVLAGYQSYLKFVRNAGTSHLAIGIAGAAIGIIGNQLVARYKGRVGRRIQSATLQADAKHSWLDALSSLGALVGLVIVATGRRWGDPIAGFVVTLFIVQVGFTVTREIVHHLMDGVVLRCPASEAVGWDAHSRSKSREGCPPRPRWRRPSRSAARLRRPSTTRSQRPGAFSGSPDPYPEAKPCSVYRGSRKNVAPRASI